MVDNGTAASGPTVAWDDVGGIAYQRVKATWGVDGVATDVTATTPLPVDNVDTTVSSGMSGLGSITISTAGGVGSVGIQVTGVFVATLVFEGTTDGNSWTQVNVISLSDGSRTNNVTVPGHWRVNAAGMTQFRVRAASYTSGTASTVLIASAAASMVMLNDPIPPGSNAIGSVILGAGSNLAGRVTRSTDGLRTAVAINYNSSAPPTADTLLTTLVMNKGATNSTGQTSIAVTSGKILRLTSIIVGVRATVATLPYGLLTLRVNWTGAAVLASPMVQQVAVSGTAAAIGNTGVTPVSIEDGFELSGTMQLGLSFSGNLATNVVSVSLLGYEYTA